MTLKLTLVVDDDADVNVVNITPDALRLMSFIYLRDRTLTLDTFEAAISSRYTLLTLAHEKYPDDKELTKQYYRATISYNLLQVYYAVKKYNEKHGTAEYTDEDKAVLEKVLAGFRGFVDGHRHWIPLLGKLSNITDQRDLASFLERLSNSVA